LEASSDKKDKKPALTEIKEDTIDKSDPKPNETVTVFTSVIEDPVDEFLETVVAEEQAPTQNEPDNQESILKEKEAALLSKNLFYELKYALRPRSAEMSRREEAVKKRAKPKVDQNNNEFGLEESEEHLLENDVLKYRARFSAKNRRRVRSGVELVVEERKTTKYVYEEEERSESSASLSFSHTLMAEFMKKRNKVLSEEDEEIGTDGDSD
jgi:hypothetical protein